MGVARTSLRRKGEPAFVSEELESRVLGTLVQDNYSNSLQRMRTLRQAPKQSSLYCPVKLSLLR